MLAPGKARVLPSSGRPILVGTARGTVNTLSAGQARICPPYGAFSDWPFCASGFAAAAKYIRPERGRSKRSRARLLGPAATAGETGSFPRDCDPFPHRDRLSAFQFRGPGWESAGLQRRAGAQDVRRAQGCLHHPDASLRNAHSGTRRQSGRCGNCVHRDHAGDAHEGRFHRPVLPHAGALRDQAGFASR